MGIGRVGGIGAGSSSTMYGTAVAGDSQAAVNPPHPLPAGIPCAPGAFGMHWHRPRVVATVLTPADPSRRAKGPSGSCASGNLHLPLGRTFPVSGRHVLPPVPGPLASHLGRTRGRAGGWGGGRGASPSALALHTPCERSRPAPPQAPSSSARRPTLIKDQPRRPTLIKPAKSINMAAGPRSPPPPANGRGRPPAGAPFLRPPPDIDQRSTPPPDIDQTGQIDQHGRRPP